MSDPNISGPIAQGPMNSRPRLTLKRVGRIVTIIAGVCTICGAVIGGYNTFAGNVSRGAAQGNNPSATNTPGGDGSSAATDTPQADSTTPSVPPATDAYPYQANWSSGMNGWGGAPEWKSVGGMLVADGSWSDASLVSTGVFAPFQPPTANYAVQAEIRIGACVSSNSSNCQSGVGLLARVTSDQNSGYVGGYENASADVLGDLTSIADIHVDYGPSAPGDMYMLKLAHYSVDGGWHTYRFEVRGDQLTLFIDGARLVQVTDNRYLDPGEVGVETFGRQVEVRSFGVTGL